MANKLYDETDEIKSFKNNIKYMHVYTAENATRKSNPMHSTKPPTTLDLKRKIENERFYGVESLNFFKL